ncbi:hypothetical protein [Blastochloris viridis]|uniref:Uncharacterized protein n=1 Tax=Blastochloris viridis TaxID=1079 RepID=A0A0H5B8D1_BLAVI|nr:hypothetical protein [Blastochloris viridis]ALK08282.1 hypothetical protein BVIR_484 [Blastochloris viridis]BAR98452.1 hypothetical protein BV133_859 [Blastochloris viridis]CUU44204.1 hypothetical protein BVIRIDIS_32510 [Blastochloris viridis]
MNGNLIASSKDTDLRIGVVAALTLAIIVTLTAVLSHDQQGSTAPRTSITLSASAPEIVRPAAKEIVQHMEDGESTVE